MTENTEKPDDYNPSHETRFKKGQSGNPLGLTSAMRKRILANAAKASRIREAMLDDIVRKVSKAKKAQEDDPEAGEIALPELTSEMIRMIKDSEDRGYGAPVQPTDDRGFAVYLEGDAEDL